MGFITLTEKEWRGIKKYAKRGDNAIHRKREDPTITNKEAWLKWSSELPDRFLNRNSEG